MGNASSVVRVKDGPVVEALGVLKAHEPHYDPVPVDDSCKLSHKQKALLQDAFMHLQDNLDSVGMATFIKMFETHPEALKHMIPKLTLESNEGPTEKIEAELDHWHSEKLREHSGRIMATVSQVIGLLDKDEMKIERMLQELGGKHCGFGVHMDILQLMGPHFIASIYPTLKDHWNGELQRAFNRLFAFMMFHMRIGYNAALLDKVKPTWLGYFD